MSDTTEQFFCKPAEGKRVRKENGVPLLAEGEFVPLNVFWRRREREGDIVRATPPVMPKEKK